MNARKVKMHQAEILRKAGHKQSEIAEILGVSDRMVRNYLKPKPEVQPIPKHGLLDPYHEYITEKLDDAPNYNLIVLRKELQSILIWKNNHVFFAFTVTDVIPHQCE